MYKRYLELTVNHPKVAVYLILTVTILFAAGIPRIQTDTDPEHMLAEDAPVRVYNNQVERWFDMQDMIVVGVVNEKNPDGVLNQDTLGNIYRITQRILSIEGVVRRNVWSFPTVNHITAQGGSLIQNRLLTTDSPSPQEVESIKKALDGNPIFEGVLVSQDRTAAALYIPVESETDAQPITDRIQEILKEEGGSEQYYIGGQRVAEDVFGVSMFKQMLFLSPLVGMVILAGLWLMFRMLPFSSILAPLLIAMFSVLWTMGLMIWLGIPVHIMSSMAPVFLMSIGVVDGIHILSEFYDQYTRSRDRRKAILNTMLALKRPLLYTSLTTAAGFASLYFTNIPPVRTFGLFVGFGIMAAWVLTVTLVPAQVMLLKEGKLSKSAAHRGDSPLSRGLSRMGIFSLRYSKPIVIGGLLTLIIAGIGLAQIQINDSPVWWFKRSQPIREATSLLNRKLGGTSMLYLVAEGKKDDMKRPEVLRYFQGLQNYLEESPLVGKTTSLADVVKRINQAWHGDDPSYQQIPDTRQAIAQFLLLYLSSGSPSDLQDFITHGSGYDKANIVVQIKSPGSASMEQVVNRAKEYIGKHSPDVEFSFAGPGYFNYRWNQAMFSGMMRAVGGAALVVLLLLILNFRSVKWGLVGILPLGFTILVTYGFLGLTGKEFTMPIEVISALALGMAVDFAIHFVQRFRERYQKVEHLEEAIGWTMAGPGVAIMRNATILSIGFLVMIFAPLTPYVNVGVFIAIIMVLSSLITLFFLPALIRTFAGWLIKEE